MRQRSSAHWERSGDIRPRSGNQKLQVNFASRLRQYFTKTNSPTRSETLHYEYRAAPMSVPLVSERRTVTERTPNSHSGMQQRNILREKAQSMNSTLINWKDSAQNSWRLSSWFLFWAAVNLEVTRQRDACDRGSFKLRCFRHEFILHEACIDCYRSLLGDVCDI